MRETLGGVMTNTERILKHVEEYREEIDRNPEYVDVQLRVRPGHTDVDILQRHRCEEGKCKLFGGDAA